MLMNSGAMINLSMDAQAKEDQLKTHLYWGNNTDVTYGGRFHTTTRFSKTTGPDPILSADIDIHPTQMILNDTIWNIEASHIAVDSGHVVVDNFQIGREGQHLRVNGKLAETENDPELLKQLQNRTDLVGIDMEKILKHPGGEEDIYVEDGDMIYVPKLLQTITVNGNVQVPGMMVYQGRSARKAIRRSGGFSQHADKRRVYVAYANGDMQATGHFAFFKNYPKIKPGAHLYVPEKEETNEDRRARANFFTAVLSTVVSCASVGVSSLVVISNLKDKKESNSSSGSGSGSNQ
jgi:hypothetical protein